MVLGGILIVVIAGVLGAAIGGGDGTTTTVVETVEARSEENSEEALDEEEEDEAAETDVVSDEDDAGDCDAQGINSEQGNEGTCVQDGTTLVVVDKGSTLKLKELNVQMLGLETTKSITGEYGESKTANGIYVVIELEVTNKMHSPVYFDGNQEQTALYLGENEYTEDFEAENYVQDDSFVNSFEKLQPQAPVAGTVVFDVPKSMLSSLRRNGNLDIANFSDEGEGDWDQIGVIRTYK